MFSVKSPLFGEGSSATSALMAGLLVGLLLTPVGAGAIDTPSVESPTYEQYKTRSVVVVVPPGNRNKSIPPYAEGTLTQIRRKFQGQTIEEAIEIKYRSAIKAITKSKDLIPLIHRIAPLYDLKPIHVLGAIVGEHTFNVGIIDNVQNYALAMHSKWISTYRNNKYDLTRIIAYPEFKTCEDNERQTEYTYWNCVSRVWNSHFRGQKKYGETFENKGLVMTFFNPMGAGKTYGLGQLGPLRALMVTDIVSQRGRLTPVSIYEISNVYQAILDTESSLHYIAANIHVGIQYYRSIAGFDISDNPGVTATLYNLGYESARATELYKKNLTRLKNRQPLLLPQENYYGWLVNDRRSELERLLEEFR